MTSAEINISSGLATLEQRYLPEMSLWSHPKHDHPYVELPWIGILSGGTATFWI